MSLTKIALTDVIRNLEEAGLGMLRDGKVLLKPHSSSWIQAFSDEAKRVSTELAREDFRYYHVGSTSIPSILAKPIIDILITAPSVEVLDLHHSHF